MTVGAGATIAVMGHVRTSGVLLLLIAAGCGAPTPEGVDASADVDLPEVSLYWTFDASAVADASPQSDRRQVDRPAVNPCGQGSEQCTGSAVCRDLQTDRSNCGRCNHTCDKRDECRAGVCVPLPEGQALCDGVLVRLDSDARNCGTCGYACHPADHCQLGRCVFTCPPGSLPCTETRVCVDLQSDLRHCGRCGGACLPGESCDMGTCRPICPAGSSHCGAGPECDDLQTSRSHCGACGAACAFEHAVSSACERGECAVTCEAGFALCDGPRGQCISIRGSDTSHCGACGRVCAAGDACIAGECIAPGVRPIGPLSGTLNASRRPLFRWEPPPGGGAVVVEVCATRDCRALEGSQSVTAGDQLRWPTALSPGPHWWRMRRGDGRPSQPTPTWEVFIPAVDAPVPLVGRAQSDFNGDGVLDVVNRARPSSCPLDRQCLQIEYGSLPGTSPIEPTTIESNRSSIEDMPGYGTWYTWYSLENVDTLGDLDGDGFVDLAVTEVYSASREVAGIRYPLGQLLLGIVYRGSASGVRRVLPPDGPNLVGIHVAQAGDVNGDGYADLLSVLRSDPDPAMPYLAVRTSRFLVFGGPRGGTFGVPPANTTSGAVSLADFNGDGIQDIVSYAASFYPVMHMWMPGDTALRFRDLPVCGELTRETPGVRWIDGEVDDRNHDGYPDYIVTVARGSTSQELTWSGGPGGLSTERCVVSGTTPAW